jgi:hypothetical protein
MSKSKIIGMATLISFALGIFLVGDAVAGEKVQQKVRAVYSYFKAEAAKVGDVPGHVIGVAEGNGLNFPQKDEPAAYSVQVMFDYVNGSGPHWGYATSTWEDGSTTVFKVEGTTTATQGGKISLFKGTYTYVKGTGRYAGIKGGGSYTGKRVTPMAGGAFCYSDATDIYTLP